MIMLMLSLMMMTSGTDLEARANQPGLSPNGKAMEMGPRGLRFNTNVTLFLDYNAQTLGEGYTASGFWHNKDTGLWEELGGAVNGALMETQTNHFSEFAVMAIAPPDEECDADECVPAFPVDADRGQRTQRHANAAVSRHKPKRVCDEACLRWHPTGQCCCCFR